MGTKPLPAAGRHHAGRLGRRPPAAPAARRWGQRRRRRSAPPSQKAISAAVQDLPPDEVVSTLVPLLRKLLTDAYSDVRAAALRQVAAVGERPPLLGLRV
jgi:hypothetical protein